MIVLELLWSPKQVFFQTADKRISNNNACGSNIFSFSMTHFLELLFFSSFFTRLIFSKCIRPLILYLSINLCIYLSNLLIILISITSAGHAVIVVAEGAGEELLGQSIEMDASGNRKLPAIGVRRRLIGD